VATEPLRDARFVVLVRAPQRGNGVAGDEGVEAHRAPEFARVSVSVFAVLCVFCLVLFRFPFPSTNPRFRGYTPHLRFGQTPPDAGVVQRKQPLVIRIREVAVAETQRGEVAAFARRRAGGVDVRVHLAEKAVHLGLEKKKVSLAMGESYSAQQSAESGALVVVVVLADCTPYVASNNVGAWIRESPARPYLSDSRARSLRRFATRGAVRRRRRIRAQLAVCHHLCLTILLSGGHIL
jgi:hypothetical protein